MRMKTPPHPGHTVRHDCLEPLGLGVRRRRGKKADRITVERLSPAA